MNLLIIDDDAISNLINNRVAEASRLFQQIHSAGNGREALEYFAKVRAGTAPVPDVILLDLDMPLTCGFDFVKALRELSCLLPENVGVVILTSSDDSPGLQKARAMGIDHYLLKPLTINDLQAAIFSMNKSPRKRSLKLQQRA